MEVIEYKLISFRLEHPLNAFASIPVIESGIATLVIKFLSLNASAPIVVICCPPALSGNTKSVGAFTIFKYVSDKPVTVLPS